MRLATSSGVAGRPRTEVPPLYYDDDNPDGDFDDLDGADPDEVFATYRRALDEIRAATAGADLDGSSVRGDERISFRWIYLHMLEEYAQALAVWVTVLPSASNARPQDRSDGSLPAP